MLKFLIILLILYYIFVYKDQAQPRKQQSRPSSKSQPVKSNSDDPFVILGVSRSASDDEIKATYRELSKKNHPDLVAHMSEDFQKMAENKLKQINWAFGEIKKQRTF